MTRVGFYVVQSSDQDASNLVAAILAEKAFKQGHRVFVLAQNKAHAQALYAELWSFRADCFLPVSLETDEGETQICIGSDVPASHFNDCLLNLSLATANFASRFQRVCEIVTQQDEHLEAMREAWRWYKHRGFTLEKHDVSLPNRV